MKSIIKAGAAVLVSAAVALGLGEMILRFALNPGDFILAKVVAHPVLGHHIPANTPGHDADGFRNQAVPDAAEIIAIGDSMTYGVSATRQGSWPHRLAGMLKRPVYNMGLGGYGPLQYLQLVRDKAGRLAPKLVVVALYVGNDLIDAYDTAHDLDHWRSWRKSTRIAGGKSATAIALEAEPQRIAGDLRGWLARNSMFYSVLRATVLVRFSATEREFLARRNVGGVWIPWTDPERPAIKTIFAPELFRTSLDPADARVSEGLAITKDALIEIGAETKRLGARLLVVLIPTKGRVYCPYMKATGAALAPAFAWECETESKVMDAIASHLVRAGIAHIDVTNALQSYVASHVAIYPDHSDDHPTATGYGVIAGEVAKAVAPLLDAP